MSGPTTEPDATSTEAGVASSAGPSSERSFDPAIEVQKLRDHLSSHDKPITFLFGAGTSSAVKAADNEPLIPAVATLTARCKQAVDDLGDSYPEAWRRIEEALPADRRDIEEILSSVRRKIEAILDGDTLAGLDRAGLQQIEETIKGTIAAEVVPADERFPARLPHEALGRWLRNVQRQVPVEIFSLNYDTLIERGLEREWVPFFDGFVGAHQPFFSPGSLVRPDMLPGRRWARLWKLHGSVTWTQSGVGETRRIVRGPEVKTGEMILPSLRKYEESRKQPYVAMLDRLRQILTSRDEVVLITAGYSFRDEHINEVIVEALEANPGLHVFALCFQDPPTDGMLFKTACEQHKLLMLAREHAIVGGNHGGWRVSDADASAKRLSGVFEFDPGDRTKGQMELGDFNALCALLDAIADG